MLLLLFQFPRGTQHRHQAVSSHRLGVFAVASAHPAASIGGVRVSKAATYHEHPGLPVSEMAWHVLAITPRPAASRQVLLNRQDS